MLTNTLHGILGLILPNKATGILFLPVASKVFVELEENECTPPTKVTGNVAGEITPVGVHTTTGKTIFTLVAGVQGIKDIDLTHGLGLVKPELVAFGEPSALSQTEEVESTVAVEVT